MMSTSIEVKTEIENAIKDWKWHRQYQVITKSSQATDNCYIRVIKNFDIILVTLHVGMFVNDHEVFWKKLCVHLSEKFQVIESDNVSIKIKRKE